MLVAGEVREQAQLDLRVVAREEDAARGHRERRAHAPAQLASDGDVLQVGVGAREASRRGHSLVEACVDAPVIGDEGRQGVQVG